MKQILLAITLLYLLAGCTPYYAKDIRVKTEVGHNANIDDYNSYIWLNNITTLNDPSGIWQPPGLDVAGEIKFFINRELANSRLYLNAIDPQLAVTFQLAENMESLQFIKDQKSKRAILTNVPDATLVVVLIDVATESVVWIGIAEAEIQQNSNAEVVRKRIEYTITEMFKDLNKQSLF